MGMDVIGVNAKSETGSYFRNNVWSWRPLAIFIQETYPDIASQCEYWDSNDGDGLDAELSVALGKKLHQDIDNGIVKAWKDNYYAELAKLEREVCNCCDGTGIRTDKVGEEMDMPRKELPVETQLLTGRTHGTCNACYGIGTKEPWAMSYPFDVENVQNFANFLLDCGGFQIC